MTEDTETAAPEAPKTILKKAAQAPKPPQQPAPEEKKVSNMTQKEFKESIYAAIAGGFAGSGLLDPKTMKKGDLGPLIQHANGLAEAFTAYYKP